jgi:hypothetical protein
MSNKEMVGVRLPADTLAQVEQYAEDHDLSKSDALRRMIEKGVDLEEAGLTVAASRQLDGKEEKEEKEEEGLVTDGGKDQVVRPMLNTMASFYAFLSLSLFLLISLSLLGNVAIPSTNVLFGTMVSSLLFLAGITLTLYSDYPEKADRLLNSGVQKASRLGPFPDRGSKS